jgi:hypothetical protein
MNDSPELNSIKVSLVGLKNLKSSHTYRLEFDVYEQDSPKVKELVDKMDKSFYLYLVPMDAELATAVPIDNQSNIS